MTSTKSGAGGAVVSSPHEDGGVGVVQGLEVVLLRLAGTVLGAVAKSLLVPRPGAALVADGVRAKRLAAVLGRRLATGPYADLPEHERLAAADAVRDGFARAGEIDAERLFAVDLRPELLAAELRAPDAGLSARAVELYDELLVLCCAHVIERATSQPWFAARAAVEQARVAGRTRDAVEELAERAQRRPEAVALEFEERYARYVAATHGRLELFGLTLGRSAREWELDAAYVSLGVTDGREGARTPLTGRAAVRVERAVAPSGRVLLRGPAGSGKSTLVQWLALNAARRSFTGELAGLNRCVPFVLRLRSFAPTGELPGPADFLRAAGVPLHGSAPPNWVERLMTDGRALVLVDGVDEIPARMRARTEGWLRSLVAAFPEARYVVTTRPSAVAHDWLTGQGFTAHSLLPMTREDIREFVAHWHRSAVREQPADQAALATYERSLVQAVMTRGDLERLATNPLMCALLCALNRDRRMHLPRARKELYDAALEMLLVRRDLERDVSGVEGVTLSRDEQTALLQHLAYWLIRNDQVEVARAEAVELVGTRLAAMPQIAAEPEEVFNHLLIRTGLLREPGPGTVDFVHRTFRDYLGARAAVEGRDFGVLVRHAHDDQWDDVVRMAVGHARADERADLLRGLLRRADRVKGHRTRLVLLAAACVEHAPELDPAVRAQIQECTEELLPPRTLDRAEELAKIGELVLELLPAPQGLDERTAAAVTRTAVRVGGDRALDLLAGLAADTRVEVGLEISAGWAHFDTRKYVDTVLSRTSLTGVHLEVRTPEQLRALPRLRHLTRWYLMVEAPFRDIPLHEDLEWLHFYSNPLIDDLTPLGALPKLRSLGLVGCPAVSDLAPIAGTGIERLHLNDLGSLRSLEPLGALPRLERLCLDFPAGLRSVGDLPLPSGLEALGLFDEAGGIGLDGLARWSRLKWLSLHGDGQFAELAATAFPFRLSTLQCRNVPALFPEALAHHQDLTTLWLGRCRLTGPLDPLRSLSRLTGLRLAGCDAQGPIDLSPLADLPDLVVTVEDDTEVSGADAFPPGRLRRERTSGMYLV
ncbi:NACHT domain-containing protein [Streptomyces sp. NPDC050504]|uniref:NACHT domain-containing protein n=1 Tax=Streptomyces sp. NPDC050504 TaxID=3365618 RepID=UPI0037B50E58